MYAGKIVESGPVRQMIEAPRHPYTKLLVDSLPRIDTKQALIGIPGLPPRLVDMPPGCSFAPRCPYAFDRCTRETTALQAIAPGERVACHLYPGRAALSPRPPSATISEDIAP